MKITRILAGILCIVMVVCSLPLMASAATPISDELYDAIGELMGKKSSQPVNNATWFSMNLDFTDNFNQTDSITMPAGASYDNTNGLNMPKGTYSTWRYNPRPAGWSPLVFGAYTARVKVDEGGKIELVAAPYYQHARSFVIISQTSVTVFSSADNTTIGSGQSVVPNTNNYVPGSDWNDVVVVANGGSANAANGYSVYMKKATEDEFTLVCSTASYRAGGNAWTTTGMEINGNDAYVARAVMLEGTDTARVLVYDSIEEIMGGPVAATYSAEFDGSFDPTAWSREGKLTSPSNVSYSDANGLEMFDTAEQATWNYYAYSGWSPLSQQPPWGTYAPQAVYFQAKGALNVQFRSPGNVGRFYIDLAPNSNIGTGGGTATETYTVANDGGWMEFLVVPKADSISSGYSLYAKGGSTKGKWKKVAATSNWKSGGSSTTGFNFYTNKQGTGAIKAVRCYKAAVSEDTTLPGENLLCYYNETMDSEPDYKNLTDTGVAYTEGVAGFPVTTSTGDISYQLINAEIPVGGYAEFRTRANGYHTFSISDGETGASVYVNKDYGEISGIANYVADISNITWRTWRVARSEAGYSIYSKLDSDNAWLVHTTNVSAASSSEPGIKLTFSTHQDGSSQGSGQMDYLKIYGPATDRVVTLTDGAGTKVVDGTVLPDYLDSIYAVVKPDNTRSRVFIFAVYGSNKSMLDAQVTKIPAGNEVAIIRCNAIAKSNEIYGMKAFLWDGFTTMNRITEANAMDGNTSDETLVDGWTLAGNAVLENGNLTLTSKAGLESYAEYPAEIGENYDVSWDMTMDAYSGSENVQIDNGSHLVELALAKDGITYSTVSGTKKLPWVLNHGTHTYRVMGNGGSALLFVDGYFVSELSNLKTSSGTAKIRFWNRGRSDMRVKNIAYESYAASNVPAKGFRDDFENGATCGWTTPATVFTVDGTTFTKQWINSTDGYLMVEDEHLAQSPNTCVTTSVRELPANMGDDFVLQTKVKFPNYGTESYMVVEVDGYKLSLDIREKFLSVGATSGYSVNASDEILLGTSDYHIITVETYNRKKNARIYLDGVLIQEAELAETTTTSNQMFFQANGGWFLPAQIQVDYVKCSPRNYEISLSSPVDGAVYQLGRSIAVTASESADVILNGTVVASGTTTTLSNLPAGTYELVARSGNRTSERVQFTVENTASATLAATQSGTTISASLGSLSGFSAVARVDYLLDGKMVATATSGSYSATISDVTPENHMLEAVAYDSKGYELARSSKELPAVISGTTKAYANEINYVVSGDGIATIKNGTHLLQMTHSSSGVTYKTNGGDKTYNLGTGTFRVMTDGPYAEVYRNGQFVFSFVMPKTFETGTTFTGSIASSSVTAPAERKSWFSAHNVNVQNAVYSLADLSYNHNLDFVASASDEVHLTLNDGYYRNDVTLKGGKIYVMAAERNNSVAKSTQVATMASDEVYYRIETSAGMSRLYADGKYITTFRNGKVAGRKGTLAIHMTSGDGLAYVGVNSNQDLYCYNDTFDQSGEFLSADYWLTSNGLTATQNNEDLLLTSTAQNGIAELSSSVGNASLTTHLTIVSGTKGFWFVANHGVTNTYTKIGYNFTTGKYEIVDVVSGSVVNSKTASGTLSTGKRVLMNLKIEESATGKSLALYVDGNLVISSDSYFKNRGRIGFMVASGKASLGYVVYRGDAKPMLDVRDNPIVGGACTLDMIETSNKTYLFNSMGGAHTTTDGGKTWEKFTVSAGNGVSTETGVGVTENMVTLQNGEILSMVPVAPPGWRDEYGQRKIYIRPYVSQDNGMNWSYVGTQNFPGTTEEEIKAMAQQGRGSTVNAVSQGPSGRVYFAFGGGNSEDYGYSEVWMSDNNGRAWFKSKTTVDALQTGYVIAEAKVIETTKNTRFYFRTDKGQICYYESYDRGETWDLIPHTTPFISAMTCFNVEADPSDPDTLYLAWGYDNINLFARTQFPRTRWAVAKSTDAGETWEMVGTAHENNSVSHNMMNLNINVAKDYVYLNAFSSDTFGTTLPWTSRIVSFPKDKQRTSVRMEQLHTMYPDQIENTVVLPKEKENLALVVSPASGGVLLNGQWIPGAATDGYVSVDVLATFVGATAKASGGNVEVAIGNAVVTFGSNLLKTIDGEQFVNLEKAAEQFGLIITEEDGTQIVSTYAEWSARQKMALRFATDLF